MDGVTEKFSVFDFFNLIIGGSVFLMGLAVCNYSQVIEFAPTIAAFIENSDFMLFVAIILFLVCALIAGTVINEIAHWFFDTIFHRERTLIEICLNKNRLVKNDTKLRIFREKAQKYLDVEKLDLNEDFTAEQCSTYFAYCIYYLHVHGQDKKTEKLRETRGLSELLTLVFVSIPVSSIIIYIFSETSCLSVKPILLIYVLFGVFAYAFLKRYNRAMENRIKMVLAVYDACVDMKDQLATHTRHCKTTIPKPQKVTIRSKRTKCRLFIVTNPD